ncbi:hypothetical protein P154DRAFT_578554 [Amniculicola lignicola CBS 123094]|uniref:Uncharacterized protein n=1 Tax=Amniculicola lignicola CBS 123094 TaxID=1392246 RepID=A0A6A5W8U5_9PLEO|nr:hypothetical protein P154DRAFT_578554 [Amniculicola lignicola CBS 123094]
MGQGQSHQHQQRPSTPEPEVDPEIRAAQQAEDRARRAAAVEQRLAAQTKKGASSGTAPVAPKKKETALEQLSRENKGWRDADDAANLRAWN